MWHSRKGYVVVDFPYICWGHSSNDVSVASGSAVATKLYISICWGQTCFILFYSSTHNIDINNILWLVESL